MTTGLERLVKCWGEIAPTKPPTSNPFLLIDWLIDWSWFIQFVIVVFHHLCFLACKGSSLTASIVTFRLKKRQFLSLYKSKIFYVFRPPDDNLVLDTASNRESRSAFHCIVDCWIALIKTKPLPIQRQTYTNTETNMAININTIPPNIRICGEKKITFAVVFQL